MALKKSAIIFLPGGSNKVRKINTPIKLIFLLASLIPVIALGIGWLIIDYRKTKTQIPELNYLRKENRTQKTRLITMIKNINQINQRMGKLQEFERKLRIITNLEPSGEYNQYLSLGGSNIISLKSDYQLQEVHKGLIHQMHKSLENLETEIEMTSISQIELSNFLKEQKSILVRTPSICPTDGWFSSGFGYRISPFTNQREFHKGLDIGNNIGTPVIAPADGLAVFVGKEGSLGKMIAINHRHDLMTRYGHLHKFLVKKGQYVKRGQIIAEMGTTGRATGPHLHYEVHLNGVSVNPFSYILD
jgi:murein DD-endopeptidase MepM/ murein hydrolase activator NlpD